MNFYLIVLSVCIFSSVASRERRRSSRRNGVIGRTAMLNEQAGQLYKAVHCKVTRQLKTRTRKGLKTDDLALKQNMYR